MMGAFPAKANHQGAYWEPKVNSLVLTVAPGDFAVTGDRDLALMTLLGSCIAACICDPYAKVGGLNHFLLPDDYKGGGERVSTSLRYGVHAMEMLINELLKSGAERGRLEAKLFGGANVIALTRGEGIGDRNAKFAADFLRKERIPVLAADVGGTRARRVFFKPSANKVLVQTPTHADASKAQGAEELMRQQAISAPRSGGVELF